MADRRECPPVVAIDSSQDNNGYLDGARKQNPGALAVNSAKDLVDKLLAAAQDCCLKSIKIIGHGFEGTIIVGTGRVGDDPAKRINSAQSEWESELARLKAVLCKNATIELWSCHTGAGKKGAAKVDQIAKVTGAKVTAQTGEVWPDHAQNGSETQTGDPDPSKKAPKPLGAPPPPPGSKKKGGAVPSKILSLTRKPPPALIVLSGLVPVPSLTTLPRFLVLTNRRVIAALLGQIDVRRTYDIRRLGAGIEARLIAADQQLQAPRLPS